MEQDLRETRGDLQDARAKIKEQERTIAMLKRAPAPAPVVAAQTERYVPSKDSMVVMDEKKTNG